MTIPFSMAPQTMPLPLRSAAQLNADRHGDKSLHDLAQCWAWHGESYGPGRVLVPSALLAALPPGAAVPVE